MGKSKLGNGAGTIFQRKETGRYFASLSVGYDAKGKRKRITVSGKSKAEVRGKLVKLQAAQLDGLLIKADRTTVAQYLERWLDEAARPSVRPSTFCDYSAVVRLHLTPHLNRVQLSKLTTMHVQGLLTLMERNKASAHLRRKTLAVLNIALNKAVAWDLLPRNVCSGVTKPKIGRTNIEALSPDQTRQLFAAAASDRHQAIYVLAIATGLRQGELFGLQWNNIDLHTGWLTVTHALHELKGALSRGEPKSDRGMRRVKLPEFALNALIDHRARMEDEGHVATWVFCDTDGGPLRKSNFLRRSFFPLLKKANLPRIRFHSLRHTAATLLFGLNANPKVVQERLGHSTIGVTMDVYTHFLPSVQDEAAASLDRLFASIPA